MRRDRDRSNRSRLRRRVPQDATFCQSEGFFGPNVPKGLPEDFVGEFQNSLIHRRKHDLSPRVSQSARALQRL
jgi:hypothetical protein